MTVKFKKEDLVDEMFEVIEDEIIDQSRKFYETYYSCGATEQQEEYPYENDPDEIECDEVEPKEVITVIYVKKGGRQ